MSEDCDRATRKYGRTPRDRECPKKEAQEIVFDLCAFTDESIRNSNKSQVKVKCDLHLCDAGSIRVGVIQQNFGLLLDRELWYQATDEVGIGNVVRKIVEKHNPNANDFCIIQCKSKEKTIKQALIFPPFIKLHHQRAVPEKKINVNILVLDSVSRQHFYRQLPNTVNALRHLAKSGNTKILDYELFQSLAPRTFPNMRAMFSGIVDVDSNDELHTYGIDSLFGKFQNMGYQTVVQEDSCWFDSWGSLITDNKHEMNYATSEKDYADKWQKILAKTRHLPINSYGLTHFSCDVFLQYGKTNQFNNPSKVCYNGQFLPAYFLNYTLKFLSSSENIQNSYPVFMYTHLNTGHEMTGKRIAYSDLLLANYMRKAAELDNTLTIILSDHGPKTTKYSREYLSGRYEIAHALMFMIIPAKIQRFLGRKQMFALQTNENRLVNLVDVFHTLMTLNSRNSSGLLKLIPKARSCWDMPTYSFTTCLCDGHNEHLSTSHDEIRWLAELALGFLNNELTRSIPVEGNTSEGYGNCERLIGKRYDKIRKQTDKHGNTVYVFDIIVNKYRDEEIFEVAVKLKNETNTTLMYKDNFNSSIPYFRDAEIIRWRRVSVYQHFSKCCDVFTELELCVCRKESYNQRNPGRDITRLLSNNIFNTKTKTKYIDSKCLLVLERSTDNIFVSYEIANICNDRLYNVTFNLVRVNTTNYSYIKMTYNTPRNFLLLPWLIYYVTSVQLYETPFVRSNLDVMFEFEIIYIADTVYSSKKPLFPNYSPVSDEKSLIM